MRLRKSLIALLSACAASLGTQAAEVSVTPGDGTLAQAIADAQAGDTLLLQNADYGSDGNLSISKSLQLKGSGGDARITLNCGNVVISGVGTQVSIQGIALADGWALDLIRHYYRNILDRDPDDGGQTFWEGDVNRLRGLAVDLKEAFVVMAVYFFNSEEYRGRNTGDAAFIDHPYRTFFNRNADQGGLDYWQQQIGAGMPRGIVMLNFLFSPEFDGFMAGCPGAEPSRKEKLAVTDFYRGLLNRLPDSAGLDSWADQFRAAQCTNTGAVYEKANEISWLFLNSEEYLNRHRTNAEYVSDLYNAFMRRGGDLGGVNYWIEQLDSQAMTRDQVRQAFRDAPEFATRVQAIAEQGCLQ